MVWFELILMLGVILVAAQIFTNALEHAGHRLGFSAGVTGSIFAAVATALPEASVPLVAILAGTKDQAVNEEIGVGAILGAPLMLSTLSVFVMMTFVLRRRGFAGYVIPERSGFIRDIRFFIFAFVISAFAMYLPLTPMLYRGILGIVLIGIYVIYLERTLAASKNLVVSGHGVVPDDPMYITKIGLPDNRYTIALQIFIGFGLLIAGVKGFVSIIEHISHLLQISVLVLSLFIIPVATELPEKVNSIIWIRKGKDTLAVGNITGAMVFQGTVLPAIGILLTPWQPSPDVLNCITIALIAGVWLWLVSSKKGIPIWAFFLNGLLYITYFALTIYKG